MGPEEKQRIDEAPRGIVTDVAHYRPWFFHDESRLSGQMDSISFPRDEEEVKEQIAAASRAEKTVTVQGMRTGISGGAVPEGGHVLNLSKMNRILGMRRDPEQNAYILTVQPGLLLREQMWPATFEKRIDSSGWSAESLGVLDEYRRAPAYLFTPDPSEPTISLGGMVANNASGPRSFCYGPTRAMVEGVRIVLADGSALSLRRGQIRASGRRATLTTEGGRTLTFDLPSYTTVPMKCSAGYFSRPDMDLIDLLVGSEGTLGVITEIEVRVIPEPPQLSAAMLFFESEAAAVGFAHRLRSANQRPAALELYDAHALALLRRKGDVFGRYQNGHEIPEGPWTGIYCEHHGQSSREISAAREEMRDAARDLRSPERLLWLDEGHEAIANYKQIKHLLPEVVNGIVAERHRDDPRIRKLGTDFAVPDDRHDELFDRYHTDLAAGGFEYLIFGHLGDNNVHVNILARDYSEYERARELYLEWAAAAVAMGGTVSAEHGIGKMKKPLLKVMFSRQELESMRAVKRTFDPEMLLNRGNIFDP